MSNTWGIFEDWKNGILGKPSDKSMEEIASNSQYGNQNRYGSLDTAGGVQTPKKSSSPLSPINKGYEGETISRQNADQVLQQRGLNKKSIMQDPTKAGALIAQANKNQQGTPTGDMPSNLGDKGYHKDETDQLNWWQKLAKKAGIKDFDKAAANWKEKGGFDGLMSNPAFSLGLALMQSSANGKTINQGILDNFVKSAKISSEFKDRIEARKEEPIQATAANMAETTDLLKQMGIEEGNWFENFGSKFKSIFTKKGGNPGLEWQTAVEEISLQYQIKVKAAQKKLKEAGKPQVLRKTDQYRIMNKLVEEQKIKRKKSWTGGLFTADTLRNPIPKAEGGPVSQGQPYLVGEKGPEIIIPRSDGNVLTNDDSQIYSMLLASNPQLQKVSKQRAEKILRNRFPEYFEG